MGYTDLDMDLLRTFVTIVDAGGFTAAGARLGRTQAAMSIRIKRLEDLLERQVFDRSSRSPLLTRDGELLLSYARQILKLNDETVQRFLEPDNEGELRLGVAEYFVPHHLPVVLSRFTQAYPRVDIQVKVDSNENLFELLQRGELDLAVCRRDDPRQGGRVVRRERLRWAMAQDFRVDAASVLPLCTLPAPCVFRSRGLAALDSVGKPWRVIYTCESVMGVIAAAQAGLGVAVLPESTLTGGLIPLSAEEGFPELGEIELAVFGERAERKRLTSTLVRFIEDSLRPLEVPRLVG
ncbi:LysR family transcriptional regulator [Pyxidicoccus fallax]|uniref:LysR family transcriptional regulator n=1 Tax=Pyxidicoccus fallax TaxID=394095 RepID=A0A848LC84_9BACT|nr:LysR substrate-binding domain-containing protein [Pyxidicoccus fallax]NMO14425.1 LysR family transcriptional regulator [Pyxidicoccus fallax]NPC77592.1 LysR family transcriptional regulator [Pyxidicoccus fallax]